MRLVVHLQKSAALVLQRKKQQMTTTQMVGVSLLLIAIIVVVINCLLEVLAWLPGGVRGYSARMMPHVLQMMTFREKGHQETSIIGADLGLQHVTHTYLKSMPLHVPVLSKWAVRFRCADLCEGMPAHVPTCAS